MIGHQDFLALGYGGKPPLSAQSTSSTSQSDPVPMSPQVSNGPGPSVPAPNPPSPSMGAPGGGQPGGNQGPPTGPYATPQEAAFIQNGMRYPQGSMQWQAAVAKAQEIQQRHMTPLAPPKDTSWGPNGQPVPMAPVQQLGGLPPGTAGEQDVFGHRTFNAIPGGVVNGQGWNGGQGGQGGGYQPIAGLQPTVQGQPAPGTVLGGKPGDVPSVVQQPQFNPETARGAFLGSDEMKSYNTALSSYQGIVGAIQRATGNNGILDVAAVDSLVKSMGMNPRGATTDMFIKSLGLPEAVQGAISNAVGNGPITPQALQQIVGVAQSYVTAQRQSAQNRMDSDTQAARAYDPKSTGVPGEFVPPVPAMPSFQGVGAPQPPSGINPQQALQEARQAIAGGLPRAEAIRRLQSAGINPAGL